MHISNRFLHHAVLCGGALLLCFSLAAGADEIQDANKLFKQGQYDQALGKVDAVLAGKPKDAQARFLKGLIQTEQGKTSDAIRTFSDLTEDYPELPEPYNNLAVLYAGQGQYDKARIALEMAIRTHPSYATAHENLGDIYAKMASQAYDRALQLDRGNASTQTKLALIKDLFTGAGKVGKPAKVVHAAADNAVAAAQPAAVAVAAVPPAEVTAAPMASGNAAAGGADAKILQVVNKWAAAWSAKNVQGYLAFYAADFKIPDGASRSDWEAQRSERLTKPRFIHVTIGNPHVRQIDDSHASVTFRQSYRASHFHSTDSKTLMLVKSADGWLIQEELSGK